jgi:hypothetical protein
MTVTYALEVIKLVHQKGDFWQGAEVGIPAHVDSRTR